MSPESTWGSLSRGVPGAHGTATKDRSCPQRSAYTLEKDVWDKAGSTLPWSGSKGEDEVTLAINMLEDLKAGSAAPHRGNFEGFHPPERTNFSSSFSWMLCAAREGRGQGNPWHPSLGRLTERIKSLTRKG